MKQGKVRGQPKLEPVFTFTVLTFTVIAFNPIRIPKHMTPAPA